MKSGATPAEMWSQVPTANKVVGSVTGAVGSVTGSVGSVTGAVGSVTGNLGGSVTGSVGSVTGAVGSVSAAVTIPSVVASVQRGTVAIGTSTAVTITAVDTAKSVVLYGGNSYSLTGGYESSMYSKVVLTNSTTVTASRVAGTGTNILAWQVIEFE